MGHSLTRKTDNSFPKIIKWTPIIRWLTIHSHYCLAHSIVTSGLWKFFCFYFIFVDLSGLWHVLAVKLLFSSSLFSTQESIPRVYETLALWHPPELCGFTNFVGLVPGNENAPVDFLSPSGPVSYEPSSSKPDDQPSTVS